MYEIDPSTEILKSKYFGHARTQCAAQNEVNSCYTLLDIMGGNASSLETSKLTCHLAIYSTNYNNLWDSRGPSWITTRQIPTKASHAAVLIRIYDKVLLAKENERQRILNEMGKQKL